DSHSAPRDLPIVRARYLRGPPRPKFYPASHVRSFTWSKRDRNPQEGCRNGSSILAGALVLAVEQLFQLPLQVRRPAILFRGIECTHGRPIVFPEFIHKG